MERYRRAVDSKNGPDLPQDVILADTQVIFRKGAARVLAMESDIRLAAQCKDVACIVEALQRTTNAVVVFSSNLTPDLSDVLEKVLLNGGKSILILEKDFVPSPGLNARAQGILLRSVSAAQLVQCIRRVATGHRWRQQTDSKDTAIADAVGDRVLKRLTPKELQILALAADGGSNKVIASQLLTTEQVIKNYLRTIYDKTGVSDRLELSLFVVHHPALVEAATKARADLAKSST